MSVILLALLAGSASPAFADQQADAAAAAIQGNIDRLGSLDFPVRMQAARLIRRTDEKTAVPALIDAVRKASNEFVRYRALVLLTAFNDPRTGDLMRELVKDKNDRVRQVAFGWLERRPDRSSVSVLLPLLESEQSDFVRPALVGALAALGYTPVQRPMIAEVARGPDFFRSAVIDALGRHGAAYALDAIVVVARVEGPLQDDAVLAVGRIGGPDAQEILGEAIRFTPEAAVMRQAARCLIGVDCPAAIQALTATAGSATAKPAEVRAAFEGLAAIAQNRDETALTALLTLTSGPQRERAAVALSVVAIRQPDWTVAWLRRADAAALEAALQSLKDGFDSLEEDFAEEQFFAAVRAGYWRAPDASPERALAAAVIQRLEF